MQVVRVAATNEAMRLSTPRAPAPVERTAKGLSARGYGEGYGDGYGYRVREGDTNAKTREAPKGNRKREARSGRWGNGEARQGRRSSPCFFFDLFDDEERLTGRGYGRPTGYREQTGIEGKCGGEWIEDRWMDGWWHDGRLPDMQADTVTYATVCHHMHANMHVKMYG